MASPQKVTSSVMLWTLPGTFEQRVEIAARAGMQSVELRDEHVKWTDAEVAAKLKFVRSFYLGIDAIGATGDLQKDLEWARKLEAPQVISKGGNLEGLKRDAELAAKAKVTLLIASLKLVKEVNSPSVKLLFDLYEEQAKRGDVTRTLIEAAPHVAVFHVADIPELNFPHLYRAIQKTGFSGAICMAYLPLQDPVASLRKSVDEMRAGLMAAPSSGN